jgi:hypothetical protein
MYSMLGSLTLYRRLLFEHVFSNQGLRALAPFSGGKEKLERLPSFGHGIAGIMAGSTVSFIAAPVEHIKARLQIQYAADKSKRLYSGPIDCTKKIVRLLPPQNIVWSLECFSVAWINPYSCARTVSPASITVSARHSSSAPSSSSGGDPTTSSRASSTSTRTYPRRSSISGLVASPPRSFG